MADPLSELFLRDLASMNPQDIRRALSLLSPLQRKRLSALLSDRLQQVPSNFAQIH